jgi:hypothetical protein
MFLEGKNPYQNHNSNWGKRSEDNQCLSSIGIAERKQNPTNKQAYTK